MLRDEVLKSFQHHQGRKGKRGGSLPRGGSLSANDIESPERITHPETMDVGRSDLKGLARASIWATKKIRELQDQGKKNLKTITQVSPDGKTLTYSIQYDGSGSAQTPKPVAPPKPIETPKPIEAPKPHPIIKLIQDQPVESPKPIVDALSDFRNTKVKPVGKKARNLLDVPNAKTEQRKMLKSQTETIISEIDRIHGFPDESEKCDIELSKLAPGKMGRYVVKFVMGNTDNGMGWVPKSRDIKISDGIDKTSAAGTVTHEIGHYLDNMLGISQTGKQDIDMTQGISPSKNPQLTTALLEWSSAIKSSPSVKLLEDKAHHPSKYATTITTALGGKFKRNIDAGFFGYYLKTNELWARSYNQYIGMKSKNADILADIKNDNEGMYAHQWSDDEFVPIGNAIEKILRTAGLMK